MALKTNSDVYNSFLVGNIKLFFSFFTVVVPKKVVDFFQDNFLLKSPFSIQKKTEVVNVNLNQDLVVNHQLNQTKA